MIRSALPPLLFLLLVAAGTQRAPSVRAPLPFDHGVHGAALDRAGLSCVDCHPVGARPEQPLPEPPTATCHGCHLGELPGAPRRAPRECSGCHDVRAELIPPSHGVDWIHRHGGEARARGQSCTDCHDTHACVDCHEGRGALQRTPHPPGFRTTHGVEARLDPMSCTTCHTGETCTSCHTKGVTPW